MPEEESTFEGGCQCGAVHYAITGACAMAALCHCTMCRRANAAPVVAWAMFQQTQVRFAEQAPTIYKSSPGVRRGFCQRCGTQLSFSADFLPCLIDITVGSLGDPGRLPPTLHYWDSERLPWLHLADDLPRHAQFPPTE